MADHLKLEDIDESVRSKVYTQDYSPKPSIDGVEIVKLNNFVGEEGDFTEIMRFESDQLESVSGFKIAQVNRSRVFAGSVKAWHFHLRQDEIWYVSPHSHLFVGLWDIRKGSKTFNQTMRINLGGTRSQLVYIPKGVAHGSGNYTTKPIDLYYFVSEKFDKERPDEHRIPWNTLGVEFWTPQKD